MRPTLRSLVASGLCRLLYPLLEQLGNDLVDHLIRQRPDFLRGFGLNRMRHEYGLVLRHAEGGTLGMGSGEKFGCRHVGGGNAFFFKVDDIVRTARYARPSIAQGFDQGIAFLDQLGLQRLGRRAGHRRFHPP